MANGTEHPTVWWRKVKGVLRCWRHEPIGIAVPLGALLIVLLAPQMPDIFAGIVGWWRSLFFAVSVAFLGFSAWYWTRAALMAREEESDAQRHEKKLGAEPHRRLTPEKWSLEWAPRIALLLCGTIIAFAPFMISYSSERSFWWDVPWLAVILGLCFIIVSFLFIHYRHNLNFYSDREPPKWMWKWRPTSVIAAAPFGWPFALVLLILSGLSAWILATHHAWFGYIFSNWPSSWPAGPEYAFYAPTAAIFALGLVIPLLVMALALLRGAVHLVLWLLLLGRRQQPSLSSQQDSLKVNETPLGKCSSDVGLVLLVVWIFVFPLTGEPEKLYEVRTVSTEKMKLNEPSGACETGDGGTPAGNGLRRPCLRQAVEDWYEAKVAGHPEGRPMPMIIVAAEGGASRAAVWMLSAMKLLDSDTNNDFGRYLFAISGVSGGSLGAVTYLQALRQYDLPEGTLNWDANEVKAGVGALAKGDLLTASIATYVLNDTLGHLLGVLWKDVDDRSIALEKTIERYWQSEAGLKIPSEQAGGGFVALRANENPGLPHLLLNGTDKDTGRRVITSTIRFHPDDDLFAASYDLLAILKKDVFASTAITNSARFPYISPPGRFKEVLDDNSPPEPFKEVLDGGYFENYGARTAAELSRRIRKISNEAEKDNDKNKKLKHKLEPIVIVISNDANAPRSDEDEKKMVKEEPPDHLPTVKKIRDDADINVHKNVAGSDG